MKTDIFLQLALEAIQRGVFCKLCQEQEQVESHIFRSNERNKKIIAEHTEYLEERPFSCIGRRHITQRGVCIRWP